MPRRVLIVDNEPHICESLKDRMEFMGYEVIVTHDGRTALALMALEAKGSIICGVLLDVQMPVMDGMEVLRRLRARYPHLPIVMMSAGGHHTALSEAMRRGANGYILKPFDTAVLTRTCELVFGPADEDD
ncbi:MAG TPA: response regulator [Nitrospira sp.]|nr:response regulator [Nitrospira sp.]